MTFNRQSPDVSYHFFIGLRLIFFFYLPLVFRHVLRFSRNVQYTHIHIHYTYTTIRFDRILIIGFQCDVVWNIIFKNKTIINSVLF